MTEAEWLTATNPERMIQFLENKVGYRNVSERKSRLFAVASCRHIWHLLSDSRSRFAVEVSERYADGKTTKKGRKGTTTHKELKTARDAARDLEFRGGHLTVPGSTWAASAAHAAAMDSVGMASGLASCYSTRAVRQSTGDEIAEYNENCHQASLLRDIFGNPFRPFPVTAHWRTENVLALARTIYDQRTFDRLPIFADALEEAGCDNADVLSHCRQSGEHVRGCWVVDALLGKE